jgi:outer membrane protein OmpA-like peptidoglycan-associated protein
VAPDPFAQRPQDRSADAGDHPVELPLGSRRRTSYSRPGMQIAAVVLAAIMLGLSADLLGNDGDRADAVACAQTTPASCAPDAIVTGSLPAPPPDAAAAPDTTAVAAAPVEAPVEAQETAAEKGLDTTAPARAAPPALPDAGSQPAHVRLAPVEVQVPGEAKAGQEEERARPVEVEVAAAAPPETPAAVQRNEPDGCPAIAISTARDTVVRFGFASAVIPEAGLAVLDQLAVALRRCPDVHVLIEGHSDSDGDHFRNQSLSVRRAFAVRQQLIEGGAAPVQLFVVGYGDARPLAPNDSIENKARNRRIEVVVR